MQCEDFASVSRDYVRGEWMSAGAREAARTHVDSCATCRRLVEAEQTLDAGLAVLRREQAGRQAPKHVEQSTLSAFRVHQEKTVDARYYAWWAVAAAAALGLAYFIPWQRPASPTAPLLRVATERVNPERSEARPRPEPSLPALDVPPAARAEAVPPPPRRPVRQAQAIARETVTEFLPLRYGKTVEPGEPLQVVRIQLPRAELTRLGLPVAPEGGRSMVKADVALGDDGLVKAIRFVY